MSIIDLSADLGEGFGPYRAADDGALLDIVSSANIACGFHAGDPRTLDATMAACAAHGVSPGAHPGFDDRIGFGRRHIDLSQHEVTTDVLYQLGAAAAFASRHGLRLCHVSPHGRLGNLCVIDRRYARGVLDAVAAFDPGLLVVGQEGMLIEAARDAGIAVGILGFADRAYADDGTLVDRREAGAVLHNPEVIAERAVRMAIDHVTTTASGREIEVDCDSILLHGDTPGSVAVAARVRLELELAGVAVQPLSATWSEK